MIPYFVFDQFQIGHLTIYTWGLIVGLGFTTGYFLMLYLAKKQKLPLGKIIGLALVVFASSILGARLFYLLQTPRQFLADVSLLWSSNGGAIFLGGLLGAVFFGWLYVKWVKLDFWQIADLTILPLCLGIGIGRIGCFLINDHIGSVTNLPWGILWPDGITRHPVALYELLAGFLFFLIFWFLRQKFQKPGQLFLLFLASYSAVRFLLDFTRESQGYLIDIHFWQLSINQWLSIFLFLVAFFLWQKKKNPIVK
jgi:phosphatidylglycerol:prolipoprotein diacylglycerol transferase